MKSKRTCQCSFCAKWNDDVVLVIASAASFICNECVELCARIVDERKPLSPARFTAFAEAMALADPAGLEPDGI